MENINRSGVSLSTCANIKPQWALCACLFFLFLKRSYQVLGAQTPPLHSKTVSHILFATFKLCWWLKKSSCDKFTHLEPVFIFLPTSSQTDNGHLIQVDLWDESSASQGMFHVNVQIQSIVPWSQRIEVGSSSPVLFRFLEKNAERSKNKLECQLSALLCYRWSCLHGRTLTSSWEQRKTDRWDIQRSSWRCWNSILRLECHVPCHLILLKLSCCQAEKFTLPVECIESLVGDATQYGHSNALRLQWSTISKDNFHWQNRLCFSELRIPVLLTSTSPTWPLITHLHCARYFSSAFLFAAVQTIQCMPNVPCSQNWCIIQQRHSPLAFFCNPSFWILSKQLFLNALRWLVTYLRKVSMSYRNQITNQQEVTLTWDEEICCRRLHPGL